LQVHHHVIQGHTGLAQLEVLGLAIGIVLCLTDARQRLFERSATGGALNWPGSPALAIWRICRICASTDSIEALDETDEIAMGTSFDARAPMM